MTASLKYAINMFYQFSLGIHNTINIHNHNIAISINHGQSWILVLTARQIEEKNLKPEISAFILEVGQKNKDQQIF